jgi:arabinoxylan arabinofuranohydrolase
MRHFFLFIALLAISSINFAQNPIVPAGMYIADPSAHVWKDGKLYVYGSLDESTEYYCSWRHHVMSTTDMVHWEITENVFASKGENDQVPYNDALLFAPDVMYKDGTYYMYYCQPDKDAEGVATSKSPTGPFIDGKKMNVAGIEEIDPCVFMDDDGQAYYIWGQFEAKIAKLKPNMTEIDTTTLVTNLVNEKEHFFHEGGYMVKRNGIYYFIYAHSGRANMPTSIGYSMSRSPMGPFKYGGVIVDNDHCDPGNWNNHGSIVEFKGQWYVFYHRATHNSNMMRKACVEPIFFNEDGTIDEVEMTTQGAGGPLNPYEKLDAERACLLHGNVRVEAFSNKEEQLTKIKNGDKAAYKYIAFDGKNATFKARISAGKNGGVINVHIDQPWGKKLGTLNIPGTSADTEWQELSCPVESAEGVQTLWLVFFGGGENMFDVDWVKFE